MLSMMNKNGDWYTPKGYLLKISFLAHYLLLTKPIKVCPTNATNVANSHRNKTNPTLRLGLH